MNGIIFVIYGFSSSTQCYHQLMESTTHRSKQIAVVIMWISRGLRIYKLNCWDIYYTYMCICLVVIHTNTIFFRGIPVISYWHSPLTIPRMSQTSSLQRDNENCKLCSENCKLSHRRASLLILSKTLLGSF